MALPCASWVPAHPNTVLWRRGEDLTHRRSIRTLTRNFRTWDQNEKQFLVEVP